MKKIIVSLSLLNAVFISYSAFGASGSKFFIYNDYLTAWGTWGKYSPLNTTEGSSNLPSFQDDCNKLYAQIANSSGHLTYNVNEFSGFMTGTLSFLDKTIPFSGGAWETGKLPPLRERSGDIYNNYSISQLIAPIVSDNFTVMNVEAIKIQYIKTYAPPLPPMFVLSVIFPGPSDPVVTSQCYLHMSIYA